MAGGSDTASRYARLDFEDDEEQHTHCFSGESSGLVFVISILNVHLQTVHSAALLQFKNKF